MLLVVNKDKTPLEFSKNNSAECALRALCKITGKELYSDDTYWVCKVPDKLGNMDHVRLFFQEFAATVTNNSDIYDENVASEFYLKKIGGDKTTVGYGLATHVLDQNYIVYSLVNRTF